MSVETQGHSTIRLVSTMHPTPLILAPFTAVSLTPLRDVEPRRDNCESQ